MENKVYILVMIIKWMKGWEGMGAERRGLERINLKEFEE